MTDFGIRLISKGLEQKILVKPKIGEVEIERVLSEGEQKIHALSLFFGEACVGDYRVIIFDDPVNSFDCNYTQSFSERLRDFIQTYKHTQLIVFTHNWDFFVHIQEILNRAGLNNDLSVKVLEHCAIAQEYKETIISHKDKIKKILATSGELLQEEKEKLAAEMRRLIETIVNQIVFNGQRHQFKQKSVPVSDFRAYTKLVPLKECEAKALRDLYYKLSVPEHDDPRNFYASHDKCKFQTWYNKIEELEEELIKRKP